MSATPFKLDPRTYDRALACVHCGLCLPACPTYVQTGHEADSPRGRIQLMRGLADAAIEATPGVREHLDLCLDCRACETACPSNVIYHELIEETRIRLAVSQRMSVGQRILRWTMFHVMTRPGRLKLALLPARVLQKIGLWPAVRSVAKVLPAQLGKMVTMLPDKGRVWPRKLDEETRPASGAAKRTDVTFFPGCVGSVIYDKVNRQAVEVLAACGAQVRVSRAAVCCGAIHYHNADGAGARALARRNIDALWPKGTAGPTYITTAIAGCGAMLHEYDLLLRDDPDYAERARQFAARVRDVSPVLLELGLPPLTHRVEATVTYHDACHLAHAQHETAAPRRLLGMIPGLKIVPLGESDMCCGAAGTYNLTQPAMAADLAARKLKHIAAIGAPVCVTGNVGCAMQIQSAAAQASTPLTVVHPVELVHRAMFGPGPTD